LEVIVILTIKATLIYGMYMDHNWEGVFELDSESVLEDLHFLLQRALHFDNDHLYIFYISRTERTHRDRITFDDEDGGIYETKLSSLFPLPKRRNLYYHFDFGDDWKFKIARASRTMHEPVRGVKYPRLIHETGTRPIQYPPFDED
jgi:hypothetical protein